MIIGSAARHPPDKLPPLTVISFTWQRPITKRRFPRCCNAMRANIAIDSTTTQSLIKSQTQSAQGNHFALRHTDQHLLSKCPPMFTCSLRLLKRIRLKTTFRAARKMSADLSGMRKAYHDKREVLLETDILKKMNNPFDIFHEWFETAKASSKSYTEVNAVCLATATKDGKPSSRMVLLKGYDPVNGFTIFTNYQSRKGTEIEENPNVALLFFWDFLSRQIRVEGRASRVPVAASDEYFAQRPRMSQVSARISAQSRPVDSRDTLLKRQQEESERFANEANIPRPDFWGGFHIIPERFEFWQGQSDRLHDRLVFTRAVPAVNGHTEPQVVDLSNPKSWTVQRLQP